jgi:uncharacterized protein
MHLVRLMRKGLEILQKGELRVRWPDTDEVNAIRDGALTYEGLMAAATDLQSKIEDATGSSRLPAAVDYGGWIVSCLSWLVWRDY